MLRRWKRYLQFGIQYYLFEKPRGLDFTMRDISLLKKSRGVYHGYSKTAERHLKEIFDSLIFTGNERLLDIGCGKGAVLRSALGYPFEKVAGIEIDENLVNIAIKNFQILESTDKVLCQQAEAVEFNGYGEYNVFFLFNPFSGSVMEKVVDKLMKVSCKTPITVIYHNPVYMNLFREKGEITVVGQLYDKTKDYPTYIFRISAL